MNSSRFLYCALLALLLSVTTMTSADAEQKPITDLKMLAGAWQGWIGSNRWTMYIKEDGSYQAQGPSRFDGAISLADGKARYASTTGRPGTITMHEEGGKTFLRWTRDSDGAFTDFTK